MEWKIGKQIHPQKFKNGECHYECIIYNKIDQKRREMMNNTMRSMFSSIYWSQQKI